VQGRGRDFRHGQQGDAYGLRMAAHDTYAREFAGMTLFPTGPGSQTGRPLPPGGSQMSQTKFRDEQGLAMSGANAAAADAYVATIRQMRCLIGDPVASIEQAIEAAPGMALAHLARAWLYLIGTEPAGRPLALESIQAATGLVMDERERGHLAAVTELAAGRWHSASRCLEDVSAAWPHDELALLAAHQMDFMRGDSRMLRDRIARALPSWDAGRPGWHAMLGMYAFGLEECGQYVA